MIYAFTLKDEGSLGFRMVEPKSTANLSETQDRWREFTRKNKKNQCKLCVVWAGSAH